MTRGREREADYVVVGAGSAGCVVAARLSEDPDSSVLLLEAGGRDLNPWIHVPVGYFKTMHDPAVDWCYRIEPDRGLNGRTIGWPRGKVLGGSSSLNGLLYVRGQREDYDRWRQMGCAGWSYDDVLPLFMRAEDQERGADDYHAVGGPLAVSNATVQRPICDAWLAAAQAAGHHFNADHNGETQEGVGYYQLTVRRGRRCSTAVAYLRPARRRRSLSVVTRAATQRVIIEDVDDELRATGVVYRDAAGRDVTIRARREVIVCAGAINTPQILMLSGIGPRDHLAEHGIETVVDRPAVGAGLQDHLQARVVFRTREPTLNDEVRSLFDQARIGLQYVTTRKGPMTMAASLAFGFMRTRPELATPDVQFHVQPWSADTPGEGVHPFSAFTMSVCQLRPESRGTVRLRSADPADYPAITANYLATPNDCRTMIDGVRMALEIARHEPLASAVTTRHQPAAGLDDADDAALLEWIRNTATTIYHPTGTCAMGGSPSSVVDPRLRVRGVAGLRVADASIMPEIVSGNTNAPAVMIGEKAADLIREDAPTFADVPREQGGRREKRAVASGFEAA